MQQEVEDQLVLVVRTALGVMEPDWMQRLHQAESTAELYQLGLLLEGLWLEGVWLEGV